MDCLAALPRAVSDGRCYDAGDHLAIGKAVHKERVIDCCALFGSHNTGLLCSFSPSLLSEIVERGEFGFCECSLVRFY
jgi:hypothetical protein